MIKDFISMNMLFVYVSGKEIKNAQPFSIAKGSGSSPDPNIYYRTSKIPEPEAPGFFALFGDFKLRFRAAPRNSAKRRRRLADAIVWRCLSIGAKRPWLSLRERFAPHAEF